MSKRQYYTAVGVVVPIVLVLLNLPDQKAASVKLALGGAFLPLFGMAGSAQNLFGQVTLSLVPRTALVEQLEQLQKENQRLRQQVMQIQDAWRENARLRQALDWQARAPWQLKLARVVGHDPANWWKSLLIDAGSRDGIRTNACVMTADGLVGRVSEVGFDRSRVLLVGDPNCRFAAQVVETRDKGIISPTATSFDRLLVELIHLPGGSVLKPGQSVVTSGQGGVFPKGINVGQIVDVRTNDFGFYLEARVKLAVNLNRLGEVWVFLQ